MMRKASTMCAGAMLLALVVSIAATADGREPQATYQDLTALHSDFVAFERPPLKDGAPDYTRATLAAKRRTLATFQSRLAAIDPAGWPMDERVDHALVAALLNGLDFELRVLRPWERDPAFYKSVWTEQSGFLPASALNTGPRPPRAAMADRSRPTGSQTSSSGDPIKSG